MTNRKIAVILDNIRSSHNVGSILRTCDGAGVTHVYLCGITATPRDHKVRKASLGAEDSVSWSHHGSTTEAITIARRNGYKIISVELTDDGKDYHLYDLNGPTAFIFGNERLGIGMNILEISDETIMIPMHGKKLSLNVSISAGIILFHYI
ncbi:RNA methyltransferase [Candidatus Nomurabacteria bacterium]|uniref:RNA methyltransferase n=1 Tax=Candidatus Dojkabacteria bacterium TaxID=2099670 RepID=A0A955I2V5_9BACT|nr:RNA methyltransferase [Candidatus Dojkabacteria bacterium]MCB9789905.1 RNA methyltransferase [Candidatus Nomurabacteria bacterium]MCB9803472.1 RNA methyltransferase [Candidatus Nomurabacteria bacterium]